MVRKIILIVIVLVMVTFGILFALGRFTVREKTLDNKDGEQASVEKKDATYNRTITEIVNPDNPNDKKWQWKGKDGLIYRLEATKNENGTYTGSLKGLNMYDEFVEYNFKFDELSQSGFDKLFDK